MAKVRYEDRKFRQASLQRIALVEEICKRYAAAGYTLTVRQVYYQLVAGGHIDNNFQNYKSTAALLNDARLAGLLDWNYIEDRTRNLAGLGHWDSPSNIIGSAASSFRLDKWADQDHYIEIWVEKEALVGVIKRVADELDLNYFACKGYVSQSEMRDAAMRFQQNRRYKNGRFQKQCHLIHLGDHDPSGIHMTKDIDGRLNDTFGAMVDVRRVALIMEQIERYSPPENPAKESDARFADYQAEFGDSSWELDALSPDVMHALIRQEVLQFRDQDRWDAKVQEEAEGKALLEVATENWEETADWLKVEFADDFNSKLERIEEEREELEQLRSEQEELEDE